MTLRDFAKSGRFLFPALWFFVVILFPRSSVAQLRATLPGSVPQFGASAASAVDTDGNAWMFIGSPQDGWLRIYRFNPNNTGNGTNGWELSQSLQGSPLDDFGRVLESDGNTLLVGAPLLSGQKGGVVVYQRNGTAWNYKTDLVPPVNAGDKATWVEGISGHSIDVYGDLISIGVPLYDGGLGAVYTYVRNASGTWVYANVLTGRSIIGGGSSHRFGHAVALDGNRLVVGAPITGDNRGEVRSFTRSGNSWVHEQKFGGVQSGPIDGNTPQDSKFGFVVEVSGNRIIVGAPRYDNFKGNGGGVWIFDKSSGVWERKAVFAPADIASDDEFGASVAIRGDVAVIGAPLHNTSSADAGTVYIYHWTGSVWNYLQTLNPYSGFGSTNKRFGQAIALGGSLKGGVVQAQNLVAGAPGPGINGEVLMYEFIPRRTNVQASDGSGDMVEVTWTNRGSLTDADGIKVYRDGVEIANLPASSNRHTDNAATSWRSHTYAVAAYKTAFGVSGESQQIADAGFRATPVASVSATDNQFRTKVEVSWTLPAGFASSDISGFRVYRRKNVSGSTFALMTAVSRTTLLWSDTNLEPSPNQYEYAVTPYSGNMEAAYRTDIGSRLTAMEPVSATKGDFTNRTVISWNAVSGATGYTVLRDNAIIAANITGTSYTDTQGQRGIKYKYCVRPLPQGVTFTAADTACDVGGRFSEAPVVTATDGAFSDKAEIRWTYTPAFETGLRIERRDLNTGTVETLEQSLPATPAVYNDRTGNPGTLYEYCITAFKGNITAQGCDAVGWRRPNGVIGGRIKTQSNTNSVDAFVYAESPFNRALRFDGANDRVDAGALTLNNTSFTIEFWARRSVLGANWILGQGTGVINQGLHVGFRPGNQFSFGFWANDLNSAATDVTTTWHHWAVTYNRTTGDRIIYRDGELFAQDKSPGTYQGTGNLYFGQSPAGFFNGDLDEVRVWNRVRTQLEIRRDAGRLLQGTEANLLSYWRFDVQTGTVVPDHTGNGRHGRLENGVRIIDKSNPQGLPPVFNGEFTSTDGNYRITSIDYGEQSPFNVTPFKVSPSDPTSFINSYSSGNPAYTLHTFEPSRRNITLFTNGAAANGIDFTDMTEFSITGTIRHLDLGNQSAAGVSYAEGIGIQINGQATPNFTDAAGQYEISRAPGAYTLTPVKPGHKFNPPELRINFLDRNLTQQDFVDLTTAKLMLNVAGGCGVSIGTATILVESVNKAYTREVTVPGALEIEVPPLDYTVKVLGISSGNASQDLAVREFFDQQGAQPVNLTQPIGETGVFADTVSFIYRAPPLVRILGFPEPQSVRVSPQSTVVVPVVEQFSGFEVTVQVMEQYISGTDTATCAVTRGHVIFHDDVSAGAAEDSVALNERGEAVYRLTPGVPNIASGGERPFQKRFEAVASVDGQYPAAEQWVIVTGHRPRNATFATVTPEIPIMILRDPPGDQSSSFLEQGSSTCTTWGISAEASVGASLTQTVYLGKKFEAGTSGLGFYYSEETEIESEFNKTITLTASNKNVFETEYCLSTSERFSTSEGDVILGPRGDVFIGAAVNLIYALTDVIDVKGGAIEQDTSLVVAPDGFATTYLYTEGFIRSTLLPNLATIRDLKRGQGDVTGAEDIENSMQVWQQILEENIAMKRNAKQKENISFDAGAAKEYASTDTRSERITIEFAVSIDNEIAAKAGIKIGGTGGGLSGKANLKLAIGATTAANKTSSTTVGYKLGDDDAGDFFSVDVKTDKAFGTPVFDLVSGTSSCPWEPWIVDPSNPNAPRTQRRDLPRITVSPFERNNINPDGTASFTLSLLNLSESDEAREYIVTAVQNSNPEGAAIRINQAASANFFINPRQTQQAELTVTRGQEAFIYEDLQIMIYADCELANWRNGGTLYAADTVSVDVRFQQPCSPIRIAEPAEGWVLNRAGGNGLTIVLTDFDRLNPELETLALQYARAGEAVWTNIPSATFVRQEDGSWKTLEGGIAPITENTYGFEWNVPAGLPDGAYKLRATAQCKTLGQFLSATVPGDIDRTAPVVFGRPQPADGILSGGDEILVEFSEEIDCGILTQERFELRDVLAGNSFVVDHVCNAAGTEISFTPRGVSPDDLKGRTLQMTLIGAQSVNGVEQGIRDLYGNVMQQTVSWVFFYGESPLVWQPSFATASFGAGVGGTLTARLRNNGAQEIAYTLEGMPDWLTPNSPSGTVAPSTTLPLNFAVSNTLPNGVFEAVVYANTGAGKLPLMVQVNVGAGTVPLAWEPTNINTTFKAGEAGTVRANLRNLGTQAVRFEITQLPAWLTAVPDTGTLTVNSSAIINLGVAGATAAGEYTAIINATTVDGSMALPVRVEINATGDPGSGGLKQNLATNKGWTWFSINVDAEATSIDTALASLRATGTANDYLIGALGQSRFSAATGTWSGDITTIEPGTSYHLYRANAGNLTVEGTAADPATPIPVVKGWNHLGYLPFTAMPISQALASLRSSGAAADVIKGDQGTSMFFPADGNWYGAITHLEPGRGYRLLRANDGTLTYVSGGTANGSTGSPGEVAPENQSGAAASNDTATAASVTVDPSQFEHSMSLAAIVLEGSVALSGPNYVVVAYVGEEARGVGRLVRISSLDQYRAIVTVFGNRLSGERVDFRLLDENTNVIRTLKTESSIEFKADVVLATIASPLALQLGSPTSVSTPQDATPVVFDLAPNYPNPFNPSTQIQYALPKTAYVSIEIYDILGQKVATLISEKQTAGYYTVVWNAANFSSGTYLYVMRAESFVKTRKLLLIK